MKQFRFAQKAFIVNENCLLLVKKSKDDPFHPNEWEVPGGRMEFGEDIEAHIKREVREEVGLEIQPREPFAMWTWILNKKDKNGETNQVQIIAVGRICEAKDICINTHGRVEDDFLDDIAWVPIKDLLSYNLIPDIVPAMKKFIERYSKEHGFNN